MLIVEMGKIEINRRLYWIYANCRDGQNRINCGHIKIMLFIEIIKIKLTGGHIEFMLIIEIRIEMAKLTGGHIEFMLIIEMAKIEINRRLYWIDANCRDGQNRN